MPPLYQSDPEPTEPTNYIDKARLLVVKHVNERFRLETVLTEQDVYIVWFSKTLQHWKALVGTRLPDQTYYEITYNGDKKETYFDVYMRFEHLAIPDEAMIW